MDIVTGTLNSKLKIWMQCLVFSIKPEIRKLVFFFLLIQSFCLQAQKYVFNHYTQLEGLPHPIVYTIDQGAMGYLWIGTAEGLCRYDGESFVNYTKSSGLAENFINSSLIDSYDRKWFGHYQGGITILDKEKFNVITKDSLIVKDSIFNNGKLSSSRINKLFESKDKRIWVCTQSDGLLVINKNLRISTVSGISREEIAWSMSETNEHQLIVGTSEGIKVLNPDGSFSHELADLYGTQIISINKLSGNSFLAASEFDGIYSITMLKNKKYIVKRVIEPRSDDKLVFLSVGKDHEIWTSRSETGVTRNLLVHDTLFAQESYNTKTGLKFNFVKSYLKDREGNIWLGTFGDGLYQLTNHLFTIYKLKTEDKENIKSINFITPNKMLACFDNGINLYQPLDHFLPYKDNDLAKNKMFANAQINYTYYDREGYIYVAVMNEGVYRSKKDKLIFEKWFYATENTSSNHVNHIAQDSTGNIWISTEYGAFMFDKKTKKFSTFNMTNGLAHNYIYSSFIDSKNRVWFATHQSSISRYMHGKITSFSSDINSTGLNANCFTEDKLGNIWVGTEKGVLQFKNDSIVNNFRTDDGLGSEFCYTLAVDPQNNLWVGHKNGLSKIDFRNERIYFFRNTKYLQGVEVNPNSATKDAEGNIWYGTNNGLLKYDPSKDHINSVEPITNIIGLKLFSQDIDWKKFHYKENFLSPPNNIELPYNENHITFNFKAICLTEPDKVRYKYFLEGWDNAWSTETEQTFVAYPNLQPGVYTFKLVAMNNDGVWNKKPTVYTFEIKPPYWKTLWFNAALVIAILLIIYLIFKIRTERLRDQKRKLEQEKLRLESEIRDRKAAEKKLNENEKALKDTNEELNMLIWRSYHDLRGPATTIQGLVNVALLSEHVDHKYLVMIRNTTLRLDSILKDLFKVSNIKHQEHHVEAINIHECIQEVLHELSEQHQINTYDLIIDVKEGNEAFYCDKILFKLLLYNILNNSFCYSPEGSKISIKGKIHQQDLKLLISDNGIGIHETVIKKVFEMFYKGTAKSKGNGLGLYMVRKIIEILSGSVKILSKEGKGTAVLFRIKSLQPGNDNLLPS